MAFADGPKKKKAASQKKKSAFNEAEENAARQIPHSIVFSRDAGKSVQQLCHEFRTVMLPYTAANLRERRNNTIGDFLRLSTNFGIKQFMIFSNSKVGTARLRIATVPQGPTLYFTIESFALRADVMKDSRISTRFKAPPSPADQQFPALPILNNFVNATGEHWKTCVSVIQGMFPALRVDTVKVSECRRVILFHRNPDTDLIDVRHFAIRTSAAGKSRVVRKMAKAKHFAAGSALGRKLQKINDIAELFDHDGQSSDSEAELEEVTMPQDFKDMRSGANAKIRLVELGPRMTLKLVKIEAGFLGGETVWHHDEAKRMSEHKAGSDKQQKDWLSYFRQGWENPLKAAKKKKGAEEHEEGAETEGKRTKKSPKVEDEDDWDAGDEDGFEEEGADFEDDEEEGGHSGFSPENIAALPEVLRPEQRQKKFKKREVLEMKDAKRRKILESAGKV